MKRTTITLDDELEKELTMFLESQETAPSVTTVIRTALREYLDARRWKSRGFSAPRGPLQAPVSKAGSGYSDISVEHDRHLADGSPGSD